MMPSVATSADGDSWPPVTTQELGWTPRIPVDLISRSVREAHRGPYRAAVVPRIASSTLRLPGEVSALVSDATAAIARFDAELGDELAPFATVLLRSESASSSMIENLSSGAKAIVLAEMGRRDKRNATQIVGNVAAMRAALALADRLDTEAILAMHRALLTLHDPEIAGVLRTEQVWIGGDSYGPHGALFIPPPADAVPGLLLDLVAFMARSDLPVLVQAALAHAQFETIHPFADGNGRTGRALVHAMLRGGGLTRSVTVPVSAGLLGDTARYFQALTDYREGEPLAIVSLLAEASFAAMRNARTLVKDLRTARRRWEGVVRARRGAGAWALADLLVRQPVVDGSAVAAGLGISRDNAMRAISPLADAGVLTEFTGDRRNRMWQSTEVLSALDGFAARSLRGG